ncbi:hypothetical protein V5799_023333 [Amblyomma americanum]|uniref:Integrase catalytic domain-containing protein n=1 Tax=Amblyomma americanum TaxID=6943 RepID=A0AAQ4FJJ1_AMBAM
MFANQWIPDIVVSDNGPAFISDLYATFLKKNGVRRMLVPPYHPASNGAAERAVQTLKQKLQKAGPGNLRAQIARFLLRYRSTPPEVKECSPAELQLGRKMKTAMYLLRPDLRATVEQKQLKQIRCDQRTKPQIQGLPGDQTDDNGRAIMIISGRQIRYRRLSITHRPAQSRTLTFLGPVRTYPEIRVLKSPVQGYQLRN